jgi:hypothetical protein
MADVVTLKEAVDGRGPYAVWDLMTEDEQREAAAALWQNADRESRSLIELSLAKDLRFRAKSVRRLSADRVVGRLVRLADELPDNVVFQFLFHLHMAARRELLEQFLDAVGLPHKDGVLDLPDGAEAPEAESIKKAAGELLDAHDRQGLVYLATLKVADKEFWAGVDGVLEGYSEDGSPIDT